MALSHGAIEGIKKGDIANEPVTVKVSAFRQPLGNLESALVHRSAMTYHRSTRGIMAVSKGSAPLSILQDVRCN